MTKMPSASGGVPQFRTEFNSNLYSGLPASSNASTNSSSQQNMGVRSNSMQKKQMAPLGGSNLFKSIAPAATFETNVTKYKEANNTTTPTGANKGVGEFF